MSYIPLLSLIIISVFFGLLFFTAYYSRWAEAKKYTPFRWATVGFSVFMLGFWGLAAFPVVLSLMSDFLNIGVVLVIALVASVSGSYFSQRTLNLAIDPPVDKPAKNIFVELLENLLKSYSPRGRTSRRGYFITLGFLVVFFNLLAFLLLKLEFSIAGLSSSTNLSFSFPLFQLEYGSELAVVLFTRTLGVIGLLSGAAYFILTIRRLHDIGRPGWWAFVPLVAQILSLFPGDFSNKYGDSSDKEARKG